MKGFLNLFHKKQETPDPWTEAYEAKPQAYTKKGEEPFIVFTLTESTDTILPMDPKHMYQVDGKEINDFRLGLFSLKEDKVIGTLPYYASIRFLAEYVKEKREPKVLIRGLSHEELNRLYTDAERNIKEREALQKAFEKNLKFIGREEMDPETVERVFESEKIEQFVFEDVPFADECIIAADPICYLPDEKSVSYLKRTVKPGRYPVVIGILQSNQIGVRMSGMKLKLKNTAAVRYEPAEAYRFDKGEKKDTFAGYPVDTGTASFCDVRTAKAYRQFVDHWYQEHPKGNFYDDYLADLFAKSYAEYPDLQRDCGDFIRMRIPDTEYEFVMCASGFGDGFYSVYWGLDQNEEPAELVTLFIDPGLF